MRKLSTGACMAAAADWKLLLALLTWMLSYYWNSHCLFLISLVAVKAAWPIPAPQTGETGSSHHFHSTLVLKPIYFSAILMCSETSINKKLLVLSEKCNFRCQRKEKRNNSLYKQDKWLAIKNTDLFNNSSLALFGCK